METVLENLTPGEFFYGLPTEQSVNPNAGIKRNSPVIGNIIIGIIIGGVIVYIFRYNIEAFFNGLSGKSPDESE